MSAERGPKLDALFDRIDAKIAALYDDIRQARTLAAGQNPVGDIIVAWKAGWHTRYGGEYELTKADAGNLKRLVTKHGAAEVLSRLVNYLEDQDQWLVRQQHPLAVFYTRINAYQSRQDPEWSCRTHTPPCATSEEHARRFNEEYAAYEHRKALTRG